MTKVKEPKAGDAGADKDGDAGDAGSGGGGGEHQDVARGDLKDMIGELLDEVLDERGIGGDDKGKGTPPPAGDDGRRGPAAEEDRMRGLVREEVGKIRKDDEIVGRLTKLEEKNVESPPAPVRKLTRFFFGDPD